MLFICSFKTLSDPELFFKDFLWPLESLPVILAGLFLHLFQQDFRQILYRGIFGRFRCYMYLKF